MKKSILFLMVLICSSMSTGNELCNEPEEILEYFRQMSMDYIASPIEIIGEIPPKIQQPYIVDYSNQIIALDGANALPSQFMGKEIESAIQGGVNSKLVISRNESFCSKDLIEIHKKIKRDYQTSIFVHVWENPDSTMSDSLLIVYNTLDY